MSKKDLVNLFGLMVINITGLGATTDSKEVVASSIMM